MRYPKEAPVCEHVSWGIVTIVGVDVESLVVGGIDRRLIAVHADTLYQQLHPLAPYANRAWFEHLAPLTPAARAMLAISDRLSWLVGPGDVGVV